MTTPRAFREASAPRSTWLSLSALEQAAAIRSGALHSEALVEMYLDRIGRHDPQVGAFVHLMADAARAEARRKDKAVAAGRPLPPFHGLPIAVKDLHMLRFAPLRMGSRAFRHLYSPVDDLTVTALRRAGFVIVGKTSTSELALLPVVETDIHPPTRNPWDLGRTAGGSSGGAAAAVAAGLLPLSPGSDGAGSVRIPAAVCGLVGLKPSRGAIPNPHARYDRHAMTAIGPIARDVDDAAALGDVLCGRVPGAPGSWLAAVGAGLGEAQRPARIGVLREAPLEDVETDPDRLAALDAALGVLAGFGHSVEVRPRVPGSVDEFLPIYQRLFADMPVPFEGKLQPVTRWFRQRGRAVPRAQAAAAFGELSARATTAFGDADYALMPTVPIRPIAVGAFSTLDPEAYFKAVAPLGAFTAAWNIAGNPAATLPWGFDAAGLPIGLMVVGRPGDDAGVLSLAKRLFTAPARPVTAPA